jgi:predicted alpha/beta-hydrolase family hydrolase
LEFEEVGLCGGRRSGFKGRDGSGRKTLNDGFEAVAALAKRQVEGELTAGGHEVEGHEDDRNADAPIAGDTLAADALAEDGEGESMGGSGTIPLIAVKLR